MTNSELETIPDFDASYFDGEIAFVGKPGIAAAAAASSSSDTTVDVDQEAALGSRASSATTLFEDPTYRISRLKSANTRPTRVSPDTSVTEALTLMLENDSLNFQ